MKIKVDKQEYELLLVRVKQLEDELQEKRYGLYENWMWTRETLEEMMKHYFENRCMTVMVKRDKDMIVGELKETVMDNLFNERRTNERAKV